MQCALTIKKYHLSTGFSLLTWQNGCRKDLNTSKVVHASGPESFFCNSPITPSTSPWSKQWWILPYLPGWCVLHEIQPNLNATSGGNLLLALSSWDRIQSWFVSTWESSLCTTTLNSDLEPTKWCFTPFNKGGMTQTGRDRVSHSHLSLDMCLSLLFSRQEFFQMWRAFRDKYCCEARRTVEEGLLTM